MVVGIIGLIALQAVLGLVLQREYRDGPWMTATWFGNDWITLAAAVPTMTLALVRMRNGSPRWLLVWLGMLAYVAYNYCFYLFGAALNAFFPLYVAAILLATVLLIRALARIDAVSVVASFSTDTPVRAIGGYFTLVGVGLASTWLAMWAMYVFAGRPTPIEPEAFKVVAAVDLAVMVPALTCGGVLLWKRHSWGYIVAPIAGIQSSVYLFVLSLNSYIAIARGLATAPGELPAWGLLACATSAATMLLLAGVREPVPNVGRTRERSKDMT
jgi:hypothetical protein